MLKHQLESWTLDVLDRVTSGNPVEDSRVELKREWPTAVEAARRIAGHANAAQGEPILWLIGVDERAHSVVGANHTELANWFPSLESQFDDVAPALQELVVPYRGVSVVALLFETDRAPFLVKNPGGGHIDWEVPWREGTKTRSVRRANLVRLLSGITGLPDVELLQASLRASPGDEKDTLRWHLGFTLYISPQSDRLVIPFHRCTAEIRFPVLSITVPLDVIHLDREQVSEMLTFTPFSSPAPGGPPRYVASEAVIEHPSRFIASAVATTRSFGPLTSEAVATVVLVPTGARTGVATVAHMRSIGRGEDLAAWALT
jgi:hypothetical protein